MFRRKPKFTRFGQLLVDQHETWSVRFRLADEIEKPNRIVLASASAGAVVALGTFETHLQSRFEDLPATFGDGGLGQLDRIVQFAHALDELGAVQAAHRVVTWAYVAEFAAFFWRPNYEYEILECARVFEIRNVYEDTVVIRGEPPTHDADDEEKGDRIHDLAQAALLGMMSAVLDEPIEPDTSFIGLHMPAWIDQFIEGRTTSRERLNQLEPDGLPIWE